MKNAGDRSGVLVNAAIILVTVAGLAAAGLSPSWRSLPLFAALVALLVWAPGAAILDVARVRVRALDDLALSLVLGIAGSAAAYWLAARLGTRELFLAWPAAGLALALRNRTRQGERLRALTDALQRPTTAIVLAVVALSLAPYSFLPLFYSNLRPLTDGGLTFYSMPDLVLHASLSGELTRTIPPRWPYFPGYPVTYHYAMDLLPAVFAAGGMSVADGCVRFVPTLLTASTALVLFALGRAWLGSARAAAAATVLAFFGEDLSWVPGFLEGQGVPWATAYFGMPTTVSLYMLNPMLPALGALAAVLLCLRHWLRSDSGAWLVLAAGLVVALAEYKVFAAIHLLAALAIAGIVVLWRLRDRRLLLFVALCGLLLLPAALALSGAAATRVQVLLRPWPYVPGALVRVGLWNAPWLAPLRATWEGRFDLLGLAQYLVAVLGYVVAAMGVRAIALGAAVRALREDGIRLALAVFVLLGPILTLACSVVVPGLAPGEQYNNGVWFFVQSKYLAWLFVVEVLIRWGAPLAPAARTLLWTGALGAALASGVQYFGYQLAVREEGKLTPSMMEVVRAVSARVRAGDVVWAPEYVTQPVVSLTAAHGLSLEIFPYIVLAPDTIAQTRAEQQRFWQLWRRGIYDSSPVVAWKARFVVADRLDGPTPAGAERASMAALRMLMENSEYTLFEVVQ